MQEPKMTREAWNKAFADRIVEMTGWPMSEALEYALADELCYEHGDDPSDSADEEMACWDD